MDRELKNAAAAVEAAQGGPRLVEGLGFTDLSEVDGVLRFNQGAVLALIDASKVPACDFGLPASDNVHHAPDVNQTMMRLRDGARLLVADVCRCWREGDFEGATSRIEALYGTTRQLSDHRIVVVALVNAAMIHLANQATSSLGGAAPGLSREQRARLLAALDRLDPKDPCGLRRAHARGGTLSDAQIDSALQVLDEGLARTRRTLVDK